MAASHSLLLIEFCILLFGCNKVDSSDETFNCFSERFDSTIRWNISINGQEELDNFVDNITSFPDYDDADRCIQLFLTEKSYELDVIKLMRIKLGTGGGLVMVGVANSHTIINCTANVSGLEKLRNSLKPLANVSLVALDGLTFTRCPVPFVLEEVSRVMVQNCDFM